jgi:hypothetical protein
VGSEAREITFGPAFQGPTSFRKSQRISPTPEAMLDYVAKLHTDSFFSAVSMVRHETKETKLGNVIGFVVEAAWKEPSGE